MDIYSHKKNDLKRFTNFIQKIHLIIGICLVFSGFIWYYLILKGYYLLGHLPVFGDTEIISFDGFDRQLINITFLTMFWGTCIWIIMNLCSFLFKLKIITKSNLIVGLIGIVIVLTIILSPQLGWILD
jgi:hypothetical protein